VRSSARRESRSAHGCRKFQGSIHADGDCSEHIALVWSEVHTILRPTDNFGVVARLGEKLVRTRAINLNGCRVSESDRSGNNLDVAEIKIRG
jgi:hypothetical protein